MSLSFSALKGKVSAIASLGMAVLLIAVFAIFWVGATYSAWVHAQSIENLFEREIFIGGYIVTPWLLGAAIYLFSLWLRKKYLAEDKSAILVWGYVMLIVFGVAWYYANLPDSPSELRKGMLWGVTFNNFWGQFLATYVAPKIWKGAMEEFRREFPKK